MIEDQTWSDHDQTASGSDQQSADADQRAADADLLAGGDPISHGRGIRARAATRRDRGTASDSRDGTTAARVQGHDTASDREDILRFAGHDRAYAADDREEAAHDREDALRNRTASAAAAQRALETLEAMSDGFFTLDAEGRFTYLNPQSEAFLQRARDDVIGKVVWEAFPEAAGSRFGHEYRRALRERVPVRFEETYPPLGRTFEARAHPVSDGLAVYFTDVTDERRRDERERQSQRLEAIGRVTATVAHDFNNLLTAIGGFASLGQSTAVDEPTRSSLVQIAAASERAVALTRQLLIFGREQELAPTATDLNDLVSGLLPVLGQLLPAGIELRFVSSPQPVPVFVDRSQLEQVLLNLVVNSRDAIDAHRNDHDQHGQRRTRRRRARRPRRLRVAAGRRHRRRHPRGGAAAHLRPVLLHQATRDRIGSRPCDGLRHRLPERRKHRRRLDARRRDHHDGRAPGTGSVGGTATD